MTLHFLVMALPSGTQKTDHRFNPSVRGKKLLCKEYIGAQENMICINWSAHVTQVLTPLDQRHLALESVVLWAKVSLLRSFSRYNCRLFRATMYTTVVPESLGGRGLAKLLADKAFDFAVHEQVA